MGNPITKNRMLPGGKTWVVGSTLSILAAATVTVEGGATITGLTGGETTFASSAEIQTGTEAAKCMAPDQWTLARALLPLVTAKTISTAALGTVRQVHGAITASHAAISGGTIAGVRGLVTLSGANSAGGAYFYGAQGKLIITGTLNHADSRACALIAQLDCLTGGPGTISAGELSGLWIDVLGPTGIPFNEYNAIRISANKDNKFQSLIYAQTDAAFFFDIVKPTGGAQALVVAAGTNTVSAGNAAGVAAKVGLIRIDGTTYYIPLFSGNT